MHSCGTHNIDTHIHTHTLNTHIQYTGGFFEYLRPLLIGEDTITCEVHPLMTSHGLMVIIWRLPAHQLEVGFMFKFK